MIDRYTGCGVGKDGTVTMNYEGYKHAFTIHLECDTCGKFISWEEFKNKTAKRWLRDPNTETFGTLCGKCFNKNGYR